MWEVEVTTSEDVAELLRSVRRVGEAPPSGCHSVFSFLVHQTPMDAYPASPSRRARRVSCLSFVTLASLSTPPPGKNAGHLQQWVTNTHNVLCKLERRQPVAPFHSSRITLVLRDALLGRTHACFIGLVSPDIDATAASCVTLKFVARMRAVVRAFEGVDAADAVDARGMRNRDGLSPVYPRRPATARTGADMLSPGARSAPGAGAGAGDRGPSSPPGSDLFRAGSPASPAPDSEFLHSLSTAARLSGTAVPGMPASTTAAAATLTALVPATSEAPTASTADAAANYGGGAGAGAGAGAGGGDGGGGGGVLFASSLTAASAADAPAVRASTPPAAPGPPPPASAGDVALQGQLQLQDPVARAEAMAERMAALSARGDESARWFTALLSALEASRAETRELRGHLAAARERQQQSDADAANLQQALSVATTTQIPARTADETASVIRDLRKRLRVSEQSVKDYELYKDVMETAVCRMQDQMQELADERDQARRALRAAHAATRREREALLKTRRAMADLELAVDARATEAADQDESLHHTLTQVQRQARAAEAHHAETLAAFQDEADAEIARLKAELATLKTQNAALRRAGAGLPPSGTNGAASAGPSSRVGSHVYDAASRDLSVRDLHVQSNMDKDELLSLAQGVARDVTELVKREVRAGRGSGTASTGPGTRDPGATPARGASSRGRGRGSTRRGGRGLPAGASANGPPRRWRPRRRRPRQSVRVERTTC